MSTEEEFGAFEAAACEMEEQKTAAIDSLAAGETREMPVAEARIVGEEADPGTAEGPGAEEEDEDEPKVVVPFWTRGRIAVAGGIAAALVVGAIGIGTFALQGGGTDAGVPARTAQTGQAQEAPAGAEGPSEKSGEGAAAPEPAAEAPETGAAAGQAGGEAAAGDAAAADADDAQAATGAKAQGAPSSGSSTPNPASSSAEKPESPASGASSAPAKKQEHQHTWVDVTEEVWVPNVVTVVDKAAWDEPVYSEVEVCACGEVFASGAAAAEHAMAQESGRHNSHTEKRQVDTITHEAKTHTEDQGHNETKVVGQKCSGCGATK